MHQRLRLLAAASVTVIVTGALGACGALGEKTFADDHAVSGKITAVRLDDQNGGVNLSAVGKVKVSTSNGDMTVDGATGPVDLRTSNGEVEAKGLKGDGVRVESSNGSVSISPAVAQDVWVKTSSGDVTVTAPA